MSTLTVGLATPFAANVLPARCLVLRHHLIRLSDIQTPVPLIIRSNGVSHEKVISLGNPQVGPIPQQRGPWWSIDTALAKKPRPQNQLIGFNVIPEIRWGRPKIRGSSRDFVAPKDYKSPPLRAALRTPRATLKPLRRRHIATDPSAAIAAGEATTPPHARFTTRQHAPARRHEPRSEYTHARTLVFVSCSLYGRSNLKRGLGTEDNCSFGRMYMGLFTEQSTVETACPPRADRSGQCGALHHLNASATLAPFLFVVASLQELATGSRVAPRYHLDRLVKARKRTDELFKIERLLSAENTFHIKKILKVGNEPRR
ncbi:hypothetical protein B0H16DRAFT_1446412 [Mycena metata]|uniref:Uncharacterized protein n=1 Tax=Mycena metata TaxID=1033252 RepID=A0AAD7KIY6_9AGAR|nr:hypothetical protein B0H16DRAFT_1446412 [Mycena metata]